MDVRVKLLAYDAWADEDDKTGFLSVRVDIFDQLYLKELPISLPMVPTSTIKKAWEMRIIEKTQQIEMWDFFMIKIWFLGYTPL